MSSWEFLGGENENMWMLSEDGLRKLCGQYSIDDKGSKDDLIARLPPPLTLPCFLPSSDAHQRRQTSGGRERRVGVLECKARRVKECEESQRQGLKYRRQTASDAAVCAGLVRHRNALDSSRLLTDEGGGSGQAGKASIPTHLTLPSNLESMSVAQLKAVAAAHSISGICVCVRVCACVGRRALCLLSTCAPCPGVYPSPPPSLPSSLPPSLPLLLTLNTGAGALAEQ